MIPYGRQQIDEDDVARVAEALRADFITQGPRVREFEERLAAYCGARFAVVFSSGTAALHAAYLAAGLGPGDEFIVPALTFCATANAGLFLGARPVFADVEPDTGNLDPDGLERLITPRTRLLVPVHYAGHPAEMERLAEVARRHGLRVVEDACHALGARFRETPVGACHLSDLAVFSFHPVKPITTGEGGAVLTNDEEARRRLLMFREHGITRDPASFEAEPDGPWSYEMQFLGWNYRLTDFQAALGLSQLAKLDRFIARRRELAARYRRLLGDFPLLSLPAEREGVRSGWHLYVVRLAEALWPQKARLVERLRAAGVGVQVHYVPVYRHPFYRRLGYEGELCPVAERFYRAALSLPLHPGLTEAEQDRVAEAVKLICEELAP